ncbi:MAG: flavocytochrome c [Clostridia bacterium]|nr:flavocytochrome c [Clostridia bacterium]
MKKVLSILLTLMMLTASVSALGETAAPALDADIIIVGAGGAGMIAAMYAVDAGASVILIEKTSNAGGNTNRASGGVDAAGTALQAAAGIEDSAEQWAQDMLRVGKVNDMELVEFFTAQSAAAIEFCEAIGFEFSPKIQIQYNDPPRSHRDAQNRSVGLVLVPLLLEQLEKRGIEIRYNEQATALLQDASGRVNGVHVATKNGEKDYHANAVILATGGFGGNAELIAEYAPQFTGYGTTGQATNTGDGMLMAQAIGAELINMDGVAAVSVEKKTGTAPGVTVTRQGGITFNSAGKLIALEGMLDDKVTWMVYNITTYETAPTLETYHVNGVVTEGETIRELAEKIGVDPDAMEESLAIYDAAYKNGQYENGTAITANVNIAETGPYYAMSYGNAIHYTCGGIKINVDTQVIDTEGNVIPGLYAAGETTGGLHGTSRYTGSSITDVLVFGRVAGEKASAEALALGHVEVVSAEGTAEAVELPAGSLKDGVYSASAVGMQGPLTLTAVVENGNVVSIDYEGKETEVLWAAVEREMFPAVIAAQSVEGVDTVTGATFASNAVLAAMSDIFAQAAQ